MSKSTKRPVDIAGSHQIPVNDAGELTELAILPATDRDTARDVEDAAAVAPVKYTSAPGGDEKATVMAGHTSSSSRGEKEDDRLRSPAEDDSERLAIRAIPRRYQLLAFSMIIFFNTSSSFSESTLSPLKGVFRDNLGVTNAQYGAISSASSLANTILPVLGGIGIDYWGATYAAIICSSFIMIGAIISAAGANTMAFSMVIGGRVLMGFGSMLIESAQLKLYAHWFQGSHLALVIGIDLAWSRVLSVVSRASAVPMSMIGGWWGWGLWIPAFVTVINLIICIMYWAFERRVPAQYRPPLGKEAREGEGKLRRRIDIATLHKLPAFFWLFCGIQIFQTSCVGVYSSNLADIQTQTRGTSQLAAGYNSSLQSVVPIILIPLTGAFFDRFGYRMLFISWTAALYVVCFGLLGLTKAHPLVPILIGSFALSTYAIPFSASIPIIVGDPALLGTAIGVWKAFGNGGIIVFDVAAGAIQDRSYNGLNYDNVIRLLMCYKSFQIVLGIFFFWLDGRWLGYSLRMSERKRLALRETVLRTGVQLRGWKRSKVGMCIVMAELVGLTVAAWTVYVVYALGK